MTSAVTDGWGSGGSETFRSRHRTRLPLTAITQKPRWADMCGCDDTDDEGTGSLGPPWRSLDASRRSVPDRWPHGFCKAPPAGTDFETPNDRRMLSRPASPEPLYDYHQTLGTPTTEPAAVWDWQCYVGESVPASGAPGNQVGFAFDSCAPPGMEAVREEYERRLRTRNEQIQQVKSRIEEVEGEMRDMDAERRAVEQRISQMRATMEKYCIPLEELDHPSFHAENTHAPPATAPTITADVMPAAHLEMESGNDEKDNAGNLRSKLARLAVLLSEPTTLKTLARSRPSASVAAQPSEESFAFGSLSGKDPEANSAVEEVSPAADASGTGIEAQLKRLERQTNTEVDARAMRVFRSLSTYGANKVLNMVDDLIRQQNGKCHNLSSMLQAACNKVQKRNRRARASQFQ